MRQRIYAATAILSLVAWGALFAVPASAEEQLDLTDASSLVSSLAPQIIAGNTPATHGSAQRIQVTPSVQVVDSEDFPTAILSDPNGDHAAVSIHLDNAGNDRSESGEFVVLSDKGTGYAQYVQALPTGARFLSALSEEHATNEFAYTFDFGESVEATTNTDGSIRISNIGGEPIGTIAAPWAVDAGGNSVRTHYEWSGQTLTQVVDTGDSNISYPVLADPAFSYDLVYTLGSTTAGAIWNELHRCFNCNFPINGAPQAYPSIGQILPLTMNGLGNFTCKFTDSYYVPNRENTGFIFTAQAGHVDGAGSVINFDFFRRYTDNKMVLSVAANVTNSPIGYGVYIGVAGQQWGQFASNLIHNLGLPIPPQDPPTPPN